MGSEPGYLLDTDVISETAKRLPAESVLAFLRGVPGEQIFLSALTLGELRLGARRLGARNALTAAALGGWVDAMKQQYAEQILSLDAAVCEQWAAWSAVGRSRPVVDTLIAATAAVHGLTLVTRNVRDVGDLPVRVVNPWGIG
jgi:predicted nucleic acid-binding protein